MITNLDFKFGGTDTACFAGKFKPKYRFIGCIRYVKWSMLELEDMYIITYIFLFFNLYIMKSL